MHRKQNVYKILEIYKYNAVITKGTRKFTTDTDADIEKKQQYETVLTETRHPHLN